MSSDSLIDNLMFVKYIKYLQNEGCYKKNHCQLERPHFQYHHKIFQITCLTSPIISD